MQNYLGTENISAQDQNPMNNTITPSNSLIGSSEYIYMAHFVRVPIVLIFFSCVLIVLILDWYKEYQQNMNKYWEILHRRVAEN